MECPRRDHKCSWLAYQVMPLLSLRHGRSSPFLRSDEGGWSRWTSEQLFRERTSKFRCVCPRRSSCALQIAKYCSKGFVTEETYELNFLKEKMENVFYKIVGASLLLFATALDSKAVFPARWSTLTFLPSSALASACTNAKY